MIGTNKLKKLNHDYLSFKEKSKITKLTTLSLYLIVIMDVFVYILINYGISFQTDTLNNPYTKYPYSCTKIADNNEYIIEINNSIYKTNSTSRAKNIESISNILDKEMDSRCLEFTKFKEQIKKDDTIQNLIKDQSLLVKKKVKINNSINHIRENYNTRLFEKNISKSNNNIVDIETKNAKIKYDELQTKYDKLESNINQNIELFKNNHYIKAFYKYAQEHSHYILEDKKSDIKSYNVKRYIIEIIFVLPIMVFFYFRMNKNNTDNRYNRYIISKNVLLVSAFCFLISSSMLFYNLIPHVFLEKLIIFFYTIKIPFILFYILAALVIVIITFAVVKIQNREYEKELKQKSSKIDFMKAYNLSKCQNCKNYVNYNVMNFCPICKNILKNTCSSCGKQKLKDGIYCEFCGIENHT